MKKLLRLTSTDIEKQDPLDKKVQFSQIYQNLLPVVIVHFKNKARIILTSTKGYVFLSQNYKRSFTCAQLILMCFA